jgi:DNA-binding LacI/PurR family transcriptional regulator
MHSRKKQLKQDVVADELRRRVHAGDFPDGRLPRKNELIDYFQVSQKTVEAALKRLTAEGLLRGVKGTGIFVNDEMPSEVNLTHRLVMLVMPLSGDYYGEFYEAIRECLLESNLYPVSYHIKPGGKGDSLFRRASVTTFLSAPIKGVLVHGFGYWRHPFLREYRNMKSVILDGFDAEGKPPGAAVLVDYEDGGFQLALRFLQKGRRKLVFVHHKMAEDLPKTASFWKNHINTQLLNGMKRAIQEYGQGAIDGLSLNVRDDLRERDLKDLLKRGYDGFFCGSDYMANRIGTCAEKMGMKYPDDIFLSGIFNTLWSQGAAKPISSLDTNRPEISRNAVELLNCGGREVIKVKPRVIWRQSTGD